MKHAPQRRPRETWLDQFKTALVYGMIATHVIQLLGFGMGPGPRGFADFINLITFSGFMLAFGMGLGMSGIGHGGGVFSRLAVPAMLLLALYASSLGFAVLVDGAEMSRDLLIDVVTQRVMFGWSEFLGSFFVLSLLLAFARRPLIALADRPLWTVGAALARLATTWIVVSTYVPLSWVRAITPASRCWLICRGS